MEFNLERVRKNIREASTEDLLDRITVYRADMEEQAIAMIESELDQRGITLEMIDLHRQKRELVLTQTDGTVLMCSFCYRPAISVGWAWHRLWSKVPLFPRRYRYCEVHQPKPKE